MKLSDLKLWALGSVPGAVANRISPAVQNLILNQAAIDIAAFTCCLKANKKFSVVAEQQEYVLSTVLGDYLTPDKPGLLWYDGTSWQQLDARTLAWLTINRPNWRDLSSGSPQDYSIDGDILTIISKPDTSLTNGFWFYYGKKPIPMTSDDHYPFSGSAVEYTHLSIFDDCIIKYFEWKVNPILSKDGLTLVNKMEYESLRTEKFLLFKQRRDIQASSDNRMRGESQT